MAVVTAVLLNYRDWQSTVACIDSLFLLDEDLGIVFVDNDSRDGSFERIWDYCSETAPLCNFRVIGPNEISDQPPSSRWICPVSSERNGGYAFGNNFGITLSLSALDCRYIWILNPDTLVPHGFRLSRLIAHMEADPAIGICGVTVCYANDPSIVQTLGGGTIDRRGRSRQLGQNQRIETLIDEHAVELQLDYINGACSFVRREFIDQVGLMTEDYFLYFEELDWATRGRAFFRLGYCSEAIILHHVGKSIGTRHKSPLSLYYMNASRIKYCRRYLRSALPWVLMDAALEVSRQLRYGKWRAAAAIAAGILKAPRVARRLGVPV